MKRHHPLVLFMASPAGRLIRAAVGIALVAWAFHGLSGLAEGIAAVVGIVLILSGLLNFCGLAPLLREPLWGSALKND